MPPPRLHLLLRLRLPRLHPLRLSRSSSSQSTTSVETHHIRPALPACHPIERVRKTLLKLQITSATDASRIELALRGVEQDSAPVRVALISDTPFVTRLLGDTDGVLAEVLASAPKTPGRGVLLRFGTTPQLTTPTGSPLSIVTVPLPALRDRNVELVLAPPAAVRNGLLVPVFQSTEIPGARVIEYPVHKTVLHTEGIREMLEVGVEGGERVLRVVGEEVVEPGVAGVEGVWEWVLAGTDGGDKVLKPAVRALLGDIFASARGGLAEGAQVEGERQREGGDTAESIAAAIAAWSRAAHMELKEATEGGFKGREWAKLEWWKLPWRVDDVGVVSCRVVESGFLPASDDRAGFLAGRMFGAGFGVRMQVRTEAGDIVEVDEDPRPGHIRERREEIVRADVPQLQAAGLKYLLSSLSTAGLSGAFSALLVMSDVSLYSSLTVAAVGTVGSARWLQSKWMRERRGFQDAVREKGREAIVESERWAWNRLRAGLVEEVDEEVERERRRREELGRELEEAIEMCRK